MILPVQMHKPTSIIVASISSRQYVKMAAEAGFKVIAIDAFADEDTKAFASQWFVAPLKNGAFEVEAFLAIVDALDWADIMGVCYGSGFESQPELLAKIEQRLPVFGNHSISVKSCKDPLVFFDFCVQNGFNFPHVSHSVPLELQNNWLVKSIGGSGGSHIQYLTQSVEHASDVYFQQFILGVPVSCLFVAHDAKTQIIGFNEQWLSPVENAPFRYGGAVSHFELPKYLQLTMQAFINKATNHWGLVGINSCDAIWQDGELYFLEINPRLSATAALYTSTVGDLFLAHLAACKKENVQSLVVSNESKATAIKYVEHPMCVSKGVDWPNWVTDRPADASLIESEMPLCSINSSGKTMNAAKKLVKIRMNSLL
jgi:uncharacterized protein